MASTGVLPNRPIRELRLELTSVRAGAACHVRLSDGMGGRPLAEEEADMRGRARWERACLVPLQGFLRRPVSAGRLEATGRQLGAWMLPPSVREALLSEVGRSPSEPVLLGLVACQPSLAGLPWEFAYLDRSQDRGQLSGFLCLQPHLRLARLSARCHRAAPAANHALRILLAWADPGSPAHPALSCLADEVRSVRAALQAPECRRIQLDELPYATPSSLQRALQEHQPHVLHIIAHGEERPTGSAIVLEGDRAGSQTVAYGDELATWLEGSPVQLILLSACRTAMRIHGAAQAICAHGVPAVVAMQLPWRDTTAGLFARAFYGALGEPRTVAESVHQARCAVQAAGPDWGVPVLHLAEGATQLAVWPEPLAEARHGAREPAPMRPVGEHRPLAVVLARRGMEPDERIREVLQAGLAARGCRVFSDRGAEGGMAWAAEMERAIRAADAVVAVVSSGSDGSETLEQEIATAEEAAGRTGRPRVVVVEVQSETSPACPPVGPHGPLTRVRWASVSDDERVVESVRRALDDPSCASSNGAESLEPVGGAMPLDSRFYITRAADAEFHAGLARRDSILLVKGPRQIGKTSLLARGIEDARAAGVRVVLTDLQKLSAADLAMTEAFFMRLARSAADQLGLPTAPRDAWDAGRGANENFERYVRRELLGTVASHVLWAMDEVDRLFPCDFSGEVFALLRSWHNERSLDPSGPWEQLTIAIAYATEAHLFIEDPNQSPFNVGTRLELQDFAAEEVAELNRRYGGLLADDEVERFRTLVGGNPGLVRRGLHEMAARQMAFAEMEARADEEEGPFGDHLRRLLFLLTRAPELCAALRAVLSGKPQPTAESFYRLRSAGILAGSSAQRARLRCRMYETYLARHLL